MPIKTANGDVSFLAVLRAKKQRVAKTCNMMVLATLFVALEERKSRLKVAKNR